MKIRVKLKPNSKKGPLIIPISDEIGDYFEIFVREAALENQANKSAIKLLSEHFNIAKTKIILRNGAKSKFKTFEIRDYGN